MFKCCIICSNASYPWTYHKMFVNLYFLIDIMDLMYFKPPDFHKKSVRSNMCQDQSRFPDSLVTDNCLAKTGQG